MSKIYFKGLTMQHAMQAIAHYRSCRRELGFGKLTARDDTRALVRAYRSHAQSV